MSKTYLYYKKIWWPCFVDLLNMDLAHILTDICGQASLTLNSVCLGPLCPKAQKCLMATHPP